MQINDCGLIRSRPCEFNSSILHGRNSIAIAIAIAWIQKRMTPKHTMFTWARAFLPV